jgi:gamma-glutamyltranspeptidase / glutathione hydrolase
MKMRAFDRPGRSTAYGARDLRPHGDAGRHRYLRAGGNAADAAVVASAVLCVVEPAMTGIGGDCFALVGTPDGKVTGLNGSVAAPEWRLMRIG